MAARLTANKLGAVEGDVAKASSLSARAHATINTFRANPKAGDFQIIEQLVVAAAELSDAQEALSRAHEAIRRAHMTQRRREEVRRGERTLTLIGAT